MKFNAVIGNPPYQITKSSQDKNKVGYTNVSIWQHFIEIGNKISSKWASFIHPGRWVVPSPSLINIRDNFIKQGLKCFNYYTDSTYIFPSVGIGGGISITTFEKNYKGKIVANINENLEKEYITNEKFSLNEFEEELIQKLYNKYIDKNKIEKRCISGMYGYNKHQDLDKLKDSKKGIDNPIQIWMNNTFTKGGGATKAWHFIDKKYFPKLPEKILQNKKVLIASTGTNRTVFDNNAKILEKDQIAFEYLFFPEHNNEYELKLLQTLFSTKTARALMKLTMKNMMVSGFENIPDYTYFQSELEQMGQASAEVRAENEKQGYRYWTDPTDGKTKALFSDRYFYDKFGFSQELIDYIESHISEKRI